MTNSGWEKERYDHSVQPENAPRLSDDRLYRALASRRRRRLLYLLIEEGKCEIEEAATVLTGWDATESSAMKTADDRERIAITLKHVHLPLLADVGLIAYSSESDTIEIESLDSVVEDLIWRSVESEPNATL